MMKRSDIQILRGIAIIAVVAIHTGPLKNTGSETAQKIYTVTVITVNVYRLQFPSL